MAQDYPDIEYIVVDGASTDNSLQVINRYKDRIARIISEPDKGMYEAINKGIKMATGDIVGLVHSDDFLYDTHTISDMVEQFRKTEADIVYGNGLFVNSDDTDKVVRNWVSGNYHRWRVRLGWLPLHPTVYIRSVVMQQWGLYDESYKIGADSDLLVRYLYKADNLKIVYLNRYIVRMRMGGLSTDPDKMKKKWAEDLRLYRAHGFNPYISLCGKILSKVPQFITAKFK